MVTALIYVLLLVVDTSEIVCGIAGNKLTTKAYENENWI
jgi:hypothetical protein